MGLFGGTFNPPHNGHLNAALAARERFGLDRVVFIPAGRPPHKSASSLAPARDRLRMVRLLIAGHPGLELSDLEVRRSGPSFTIDTVRHMRRKFARRALFWIVGADTVPEIPTWHRWRALLRLIRFIVVARPGYPLRRLPGHASRFLPLSIPGTPAAASRLRRRIGHPPAGRTRGARAPLPRAVADYIRRRKLYAPGRSAVARA